MYAFISTFSSLEKKKKNSTYFMNKQAANTTQIREF